MPLTVEDALRAYARMINTRNLDGLEPLLAEDFSHGSQTVLMDITSKSEYLQYMAGKLKTWEQRNIPAYAEMGSLPRYGNRQCLVIAQGNKEDLVCTVLAEVIGEKISRIDLCLVPHPYDVKRSGDYPT